ncbi:FAD-dependent monooxygenase [Nocardia mexicana]|uniref:2-polyprenyl-6-methoxyphenol hydroxylase-like FAD-dependent oxidoreductase n=1 Tax=Nocardia mexicana TaxID=279262 RepID=A0A370HBN4_9NOCA|nr:FAD-dependent monooxygenase [Nocardia mexicana]RDI54190.1 2-polyprenyl-6-methoxyphenol hydroxylase-like FAD-dependent oxidoreductase [Nocardia mexicana]
MRNRSVLISGAGIAGPALAYWLHRFGFHPTVVERSPAPRTGGHRVDIRGTARQVAERMGIVGQVFEAHAGARGMAFVDHRGKRVATMSPEVFGDSGGPIAEMAIRRTDLARIIHGVTRDDVDYVFGDSITAVAQDETGVHVEFETGEPRRFDLLIGADGVHSTVRRLQFGRDEQFVRDLGCYIALYSTPTSLDLEGWQLMYTIPGGDGRPGRTAGLSPQAGTDAALAGFFLRSAPLRYDRDDVDAQKRIVVRAFEGGGWEIPRMLSAIWDAPEFYFDRVSQVQMPAWSRGRSVLLGDAAYCASPMSGIGTSLALVGAYILAGELVTADGDHHLAYPTYERKMRGFARQAQEFARGAGDGGLMPDSPVQLWLRNRSIRMLPYLPKRLTGRGMQRLANTVELDDYPAPAHR